MIKRARVTGHLDRGAAAGTLVRWEPTPKKNEREKMREKNKKGGEIIVSDNANLVLYHSSFSLISADFRCRDEGKVKPRSSLKKKKKKKKKENAQ